MTRALIVDDNRSDAGRLRALLEARGWEVVQACHGAEALASARRNPPDLVISDLLMPVMDGYRLLRRWKADERLRPVPFVVYTNVCDDPLDEQLMLDLGADACLVKPAEPDALVARLSAVVARGASVNETAGPARALDEVVLLLEQANRDLVDREAHLRAILDTEPECVKLLAPDGSLLDMNPAGLRMLEADSLAQVQHRQVYPLIVEEYHEAFRDLTARAMRGETGVLQFEIVGLKGTRRRLETNAAPLRDAAGQVTAVLGLTRDITERIRMETALRVSESRYRRLVDSNVVGVILSRLDGTITEANDQFLEMVGYTRAELEAGAVRWDSMTPPEWHEVDALIKHELLTSGVSAPVEKEYLHKDGRRVPVLGSAALLAGTAGECICLIQDLTERRRADEALRRSEAQFRAICEASPVGIFLVHRDDHVTYGNPAHLRMTGLSWDDAMGLNSIKAIHPDDRERVIAEWQACYDSGKPYVGSGRFLHADGTVVWWEITTAPVFDGATLMGYVGLVVDVSAHRQTEEALRETAARLQFAITAGQVGFWDRDLRSDLVRFSPEWKRQIGYDDDEIADDVEEWRSRVHPADLGRVLKAVDDYLRGDEPDFQFGFRFRHKDGSYRHILSRGTEVRDADGTRNRVVGSHVDVTEQAQLHAQFLQAQKMETVGRLAGGVAHDFNNLLTVILGFAELALLELKEGDRLRDNITEIHRASGRAAGLTRQLLAFSRQQILKLQVVNLATLVVEMQSMLRRLIGEDVDLVVLPGEPGHVLADAGQMEQVVMNLVVNARDAMPSGGRLTIETRNVELDARFAAEHLSVVPGPHVMLAISDTGIGMDEVTRAKIFEPFFTTKAPGVGTGLGLATVYGIVKQSTGSIWAHSEVGKGTTFKVYLPRIEAVPHASVPAPTTVPVRGGETILVVEDEEALRDLAVRLLEGGGYTVLAASNGEEALHLLERRAGHVHLMLTDVVMPGMSGPELAARLAPRYPLMKFLYASGYADEATLRRGVREQTPELIAKPYTMVDLTSKVREVLDS